MLSVQGAWSKGTARLTPRPLQSPATSLCRAEVQEIRSPGCTEVRARVRSGFRTLNLWSHPPAVPSRCLWLQHHLKKRMLLPAHKGRCSLGGTEAGSFWFATENVPTGGKTSCTNWPGSQLCKWKLAHHTLGFWKLEDDLKNHWGT